MLSISAHEVRRASPVARRERRSHQGASEAPVEGAPPKRARSKVFIADDHPLVREGLVNLINQTSDLTVCGEGDTVPSCMNVIAQADPDIAIVDISLGTGSGIELIRAMRSKFPRVPAIALSVHDERRYGERAMRAGARGYVMKSESTRKILDAIRVVLGGNMYLSKDLTELLTEKYFSGPGSEAASIEPLSEREQEVFRLMGRGYDARQVAEALNINIKTVHTYCNRIREKRKLSSTIELVREAIRWFETGDATSGP